MATQVHAFQPGLGYVVHRIELQGSRSIVRYSAWFNAQGTLTDCEELYPRQRSVAYNARNVRAAIDRIGRNAILRAGHVFG